MASRGFLGAGDLYISRYNATTGTFDGFTGPFEATKFEVKPNVELKEMASRGRSTYGQVIETVALPQPADFTLELPEVNKESLAIALLGSESAINQGGGTWVDAEITIGQKGEWFDLGKQNVTATGFTLKNEAGATTYVLGTDYEINYRMGWLKVLPGSAIANGAVLTVTGAYGAVGGTLIRGATNSQIRAKFRLDGVNFADQLPVIVDVFEAVISADSAFDFLSNDFASISLPGRLKTPVGKTEPFTVQLLNAAV
jgi:hypothetical protein